MMGCADDKIRKDKTKPSETNQEEADPEDDLVEDISEEDVVSLNNQLDQLNHALDVLEQENESIQARILELLQSSRELRIGYQQKNCAEAGGGTGDVNMEEDGSDDTS